MDENRKGICTNLGNCKNADSKLPIEVPLTADFVCPECERELLEVKGRKPFPTKKLLLIISPILIIGLLTWGGISLFSDKGEQPKSKTDLLSKINNLDKTETPSSNQTATTENPTSENTPVTETPKSTTPEKKSDPSNLTANSLDEYFQKIGDSNIPYNRKDNLKKKVVSEYFANENSTVIEIGANNTEVAHTSITDYVEELSQQHYKIKILKSEPANGKQITKLFIKEL